MSIIRIFQVMILLFCVGLVQTNLAMPKSFPLIEGEPLSGNRLVLPLDAHTPFVIQIMGFSREAGDQMGGLHLELTHLINQTPSLNKKVSVYQVPIVGPVWDLIKGFIINGMKGSTEKSLHTHVVLSYQEQRAIIKDLNITDKTKPYIFMMKKNGDYIGLLNQEYKDEWISIINEKLIHE